MIARRRRQFERWLYRVARGARAREREREREGERDSLQPASTARPLGPSPESARRTSSTASPGTLDVIWGYIRASAFLGQVDEGPLEDIKGPDPVREGSPKAPAPLRAREFEAIPAGILDAESWRRMVATKIPEGLNIFGLEAEALVAAYKHLLRSSACLVSMSGETSASLGRQHALLFGSCQKGRAASTYLQLPLLQICMKSLASGSRVRCRWITSKRSPADALSRGRRTWLSDTIAWLRPGIQPSRHVGAAETGRPVWRRPPGGGMRGARPRPPWDPRARRAALAARLIAVKQPLGQLSALEILAVRTGPEGQHWMTLREFTAPRTLNRLDWIILSQFDAEAARFWNLQLTQGALTSQGSLLLASLADFSLGLMD